MRTLKTQPPGKLVTVETPYSDTEAIQALTAIAPRLGQFARDLVIAARKGWLTPNRLVWVHKLVVDATTPRAPSVAPESLDVSGINRVLSYAIARGAKPRLTFRSDIEGTIKLAVTGDRSKYPGSINVSDGGPYGSGKFYGNMREGNFYPTDKCSDGIKRFLTILSEHPAGVIGLYGRITSTCMFCRNDLTDERSITVGYGPTCAKNYDLPWGSVEPFLPEDVSEELCEFLSSEVAGEIEDEFSENDFNQ